MLVPRHTLGNRVMRVRSIQVLLYIALGLIGHGATGQQCDPLLLMVEGGGPSSDGSGIEGLTNRVSESFANKGVTVVNVDNGPFWTAVWHNYRPKKVRNAVQRIKDSRFWPVVVVGHSLGAATAWHLADSIPTVLLVTLDGVSFWDNRPMPANAGHWRNVWVDRNAFGPDWGTEPNADIDYSSGDFGHGDVQAMWSTKSRAYGSLADAVSHALACRGTTGRSEPKPKELCKLDAIGCEARWELTDRCPDGHGIDMRFFEYDISWNRVASWRPSTIPSGETSTFRLSCNGPANWVCYGGRRPSGNTWGVGMDGKGSCEKCCLSCRYAQPVESVDFAKTRLTCPRRG